MSRRTLAEKRARLVAVMLEIERRDRGAYEELRAEMVEAAERSRKRKAN